MIMRENCYFGLSAADDAGKHYYKWFYVGILIRADNKKQTKIKNRLLIIILNQFHSFNSENLGV